MKLHSSIPLVLCEGKEDRLVMEALAQHVGLEGKLVFEDYGGESKLRSYLSTLKVRPGFRRGEYSHVLVTRDADADFDSAWASVRGSITASFSCEPPDPGTWVPTDDGAQIAGWVIPGPGKSGMIETLCLDASRSKFPDVFTCLDPFVDCLGKLNDGTPPHEKVRFALWTIIAQGSGAKDRLSLKYALKNLPLDWDDEAFTPLRKLLVKIGS
jgi:hypothetical protein